MSVRSARARPTRCCTTAEPPSRSHWTTASDETPERRCKTRARSRVRNPPPSWALAEYPALGMPGGGVRSASAAPPSSLGTSSRAAPMPAWTAKRARPSSRPRRGLSDLASHPCGTSSPYLPPRLPPDPHPPDATRLVRLHKRRICCTKRSMHPETAGNSSVDARLLPNGTAVEESEVAGLAGSRDASNLTVALILGYVRAHAGA